MDILIYLQNFLSGKSLTGYQFNSSGPRLGLIGVAGFSLGLSCGIHLGILFISILFCFHKEAYLITLIHWSIYFILLCSFHFLEFYSVAVYNPKDLSYESYLISHSKSYTLAAIASWVEFWIESLLFKWKFSLISITIGLVLVIGGQIVRHLAMRQCGENFSHFIIDERTESHQLVTHGIYSFLRHPAYFGWFYWSVGTQLLLVNPICTVAYAVTSWYFFQTRIPYEEGLLREFYPDEYPSYMERSIIGIPFISTGDTKKND